MSNLTQTVQKPVPFERNVLATGDIEKDIVTWEIGNNGATGARVKLAVSKINRPVSPVPAVSFSGTAVVYVIEEFIGYGDGTVNQEMAFRNIPKLQDASNTGDWLKVYCNGTLLTYGTDYLVSVADKRLNFDEYTVPDGALITADYSYDDLLETTYKYCVVAMDKQGEALPGEITEILGPEKLGDGNAMAVTWTGCAYATGYWLYRRVGSGTWEVVDCDIDDLAVIDSLPHWEITQGLPTIDDSGVLFRLAEMELARDTIIESDNKIFLSPDQELGFWADSEDTEVVISGVGAPLGGMNI